MNIYTSSIGSILIYFYLVAHSTNASNLISSLNKYFTFLFVFKYLIFFSTTIAQEGYYENRCRLNDFVFKFQTTKPADQFDEHTSRYHRYEFFFIYR